MATGRLRPRDLVDGKPFVDMRREQRQGSECDGEAGDFAWRSNDHARAIRVSQDLDFGQVWVNCHLVQVGDMPNGGFKHSGHGNDLSAEALEGYTRMKHVMSYTARS